MLPLNFHKLIPPILCLLVLGLLSACTTPVQPPVWNPSDASSGRTDTTGVTDPGDLTAPGAAPTPDPARVLPTLPEDTQEYTVVAGDSLQKIAKTFGVDVRSIIHANGIENPDLIVPGQYLIIPPPIPRDPVGPFKIVPDSELVYGPAAATFDSIGFIQNAGGQLNRYSEEIGGGTYYGPQTLERVAREYSVNPRILLAVLEYQSGWVSGSNPDEILETYPLRYVNVWRKGLFRQLSWAANTMNYGYYLWRVNALPAFILADGSVVPANSTTNAGTVGVQYLMSELYGYDDWIRATGEGGVFSTYSKLFGDPFQYAVEPLLPPDLAQPPMQLPFEMGDIWSFSGGPHGGWGDGSGWAAIDFAPPGEPKGCLPHDTWATAMADGKVVFSGDGMVIQDLDGDGHWQTGWSLLYLHIETRDRVATGADLKAGDRIGHASCEGGVANAAHIHVARRYNGEWIPADGPIPFNLDGWISEGQGQVYNGLLRRDGQVIEAWDRRKPENQISR
jgi:LasA protease